VLCQTQDIDVLSNLSPPAQNAAPAAIDGARAGHVPRAATTPPSGEKGAQGRQARSGDSLMTVFMRFFQHEQVYFAGRGR